MIKKLLIANRGEIVRRIIKTCKKLEILTVAIYSDADKDACFLQEADEIYNVGASNPLKSYLNIAAIIKILKQSGADAVHPGYGFLSENAYFAEEVVASGATWVGPSPRVLKSIESKCYCREVAYENGVPVVPGTNRPVTEITNIYDFATNNGYPILLKLDKGGGGKGIELIKEKEKVQEIYERISRIGQMAFDSSDCYIEKLIYKPRHIEIQFLADKFGKCVCLGERECTIQRRYQKIIEESPSVVVSESNRAKLFEYTMGLVRAIEYHGAGTIEFLRAEDGSYYFMEINARLQVEHPVSELVTGVDIVHQQLKIAAGESLEMRQADIDFKGHAIEARVYAEDPVTFMPSPGRINRLTLPRISDNLRLDHALEAGGTVPPYYDPMIAKVISWAENRPHAIAYLEQALNEFQIEGVKTTIPVNLKILRDTTFCTGNFSTGFMDGLLEKRDEKI